MNNVDQLKPFSLDIILLRLCMIVHCSIMFKEELTYPRFIWRLPPQRGLRLVLSIRHNIS